MPDADREVDDTEWGDVYDPQSNSYEGTIIDNPSIHVYIAHQIMSTEDEGWQYEQIEATQSTDNQESENNESEDSESDSENSESTDSSDSSSNSSED